MQKILYLHKNHLKKQFRKEETHFWQEEMKKNQFAIASSPFKGLI